EQRIGRIDRLGQRFARIRIVNLHYAGTVEADVYMALRRRIGLFEHVVGPLQPILARMPTLIAGNALTGQSQDTAEAIERAVDMAAGGFDLDAVLETEIAEEERPAPPLNLDDLEDVI